MSQTFKPGQLSREEGGGVIIASQFLRKQEVMIGGVRGTLAGFSQYGPLS